MNSEDVLVTLYVHHDNQWRARAEGRLNVQGPALLTRQLAVSALAAWISSYWAPLPEAAPYDPARVVAGARFSSHGMVYADGTGDEKAKTA